MKLLLFLSLFSLSGCFPKVVSAYFAKEYCSCRLVVGQTDQYCREFARQIVPLESFHFDEEKGEVQAKALGLTSLAVYRNQRLGCYLKK